ncbi:hypothetical protein BDR22DRAFT_847438 [Usnea florida]
MAALASTSLLGLSPATIGLPPAFEIQAQDTRLKQTSGNSGIAPLVATPSVAPSPLGILSEFPGIFAGTGLNLIFRPNSAGGTTFPNPVSPPPPAKPNENVLEINLTEETLTFADSLGSVPNRGLETQTDIFLNGVPYVQAINDVTNPATGKADAPPSGIHFEPGLWMLVPGTTNDPDLGQTLARMASIPHGTTINAQSLAPTSSFPGPPKFPTVDITPFVIGNSSFKITFPSQNASNSDTARLPQDLSKFIAAGTINQTILNNPNTVLLNDNLGKTITSTTVFTVSTAPINPITGGGTADIAFLVGNSIGPNANAVQMTATFWLNTVQYKLVVPVWKVGSPPLILTPAAPNPGAPVETFSVTPPHAITAPTTITVTATQIQYSQTVFLNFAGLTWPHVSVATLVRQGNLPVPASAFS